MAIHPPVLINIALAFGALGLYIVGSRRFYQGRHPFLVFLLTAVLVDAVTAILASFGITPTTEIPGSDFVPWGSMLFLTHMVLASIGFFGFIAVMVTLIFKGTRHPYPRLRVFQYKVLLPIWILGEGIALINSLVKVFFRFRLYDHI